VSFFFFFLFSYTKLENRRGKQVLLGGRGRLIPVGWKRRWGIGEGG
jgi:hypothetical protein